MSSNRTTVHEHIGTQFGASDPVVSRELDRGPPLRIEQNLIANPVRDSLLCDGFLAENAHSISKSMLAAGNLNGSLEGGNVVLLHRGREYSTRNLVDVNKVDCFSANKETCTVMGMANEKRRLVVVPTQKGRKQKVRAIRQLEVGPDGRTFTQRVVLLMTENNIGQTELARMCSEYYATFVPDIPDKVKQQHIFNIVHGQDSSSIAPLIAAVFEVSDIWLQLGIGQRTRKKT